MSTLLTIYYVAICIAGCDTGASAPTTVSVTRPTTTALSAVITPHKATATTTPTVPTTAPVTTTPVTTVAPTTLPETTTQPTTTTEEEESSEFLYDEETSRTSELYSDFGETEMTEATTEETAAATEEESSENEFYDEKTSTEDDETSSYSPLKHAIFVDISTQELRYYENGKLLLSSPVVTGMEYDTPTPTGEFWVNNKAQDIVLYGDDYESPVEYWISFIGSGYGFHDASWRTEFGRDLYLYDGSHGCVNMPLEAVACLYDLVKIGTPVFIE